MDTMNSRLETNSAMGTSETHSDKTVSDDEDFKSNIPYFDEAQSTPNGPLSNNVDVDNATRQLSTSYEMLNRSLGTDDDEVTSFQYGPWDNDEMDNLSNMGGDFDAYSANGDAPNFYGPDTNSVPAQAAMETASTSAAYSYPQDGTPGGGVAMDEMKYTPTTKELLMQPPPSAAMHYNYNYPPPQSSRQPMAFPPYGLSHSQLTSSHVHRSSHVQYGGSAGSNAGAYTQLTPGFHPNMWHPNAPYGTGGGHGYGYYGSYGAHRYPPYGARYHAQDPMMDMLQLSNSGREARNRAEKNRRDKLNGSIQELSTMVPHVAESPRRVDKTAVLRFAAHGLRLQYVFGDTLNQTRPQVTDSLMKLLDSFFITLTCHGQIVLISSSIEQHLGHCQADLYGQNILHITHPEDHSMLKQLLIPTDLENMFDIQPDDESGEARPRTEAEEEYIDRRLRADKRNFTVRLARAGPRSEPTSYEVVKFDGCFRRSDAAPRGVKTSTFPSTLQLIRRTRGRDDAIPLHTISGNDIVLVALARIIRPPKVINNVMDTTLEYRTRHLIDGRIIDCDQRIGLVAGYMTDEVRNLSPFTFMHQDDARWVIVALRQMYDCHSSYGESTYRLLTRNGNFIYLQSKGYLEIDKATNKVHSFVCINTLLDEEEGRRRVQEMKKKFSIIINTNIPQSCVDAPASDNPQILEKAVLCLIQNLQKASSDDEEDNDASSSGYASGSAETLRERNANTMRHKLMNAVAQTARAVKAAPLALVPPEPASVKSSISKSVNVVNVTAARNFRGNQRVRSPQSSASEEGGCEMRYHFDLNTSLTEEDCTCQLQDGDCKYCQSVAISQQIASPTTSATCVESMTSSLKRNISCCSTDGEELKVTKRRLKSTEIQQVLTNSLDQIGRTLDQQLNVAKELRDQGNLYEVPHSNERIDEIMEEHQKQSELYVNIKSEYEVQLQNTAIDTNTTNTANVNVNVNDNSDVDVDAVSVNAITLAASTTNTITNADISVNVNVNTTITTSDPETNTDLRPR